MKKIKNKLISLIGASPKDPTTIEGYYLGSQSAYADIHNKKESNHNLIHFFKTESGDVAVLDESNMFLQLLSLGKGALVRISLISSYINFENKKSFKFKIEVDTSCILHFTPKKRRTSLNINVINNKIRQVNKFKEETK